MEKQIDGQIGGIPMLQITGGISRKTATDLETKASFIEYDIDYLAGETPEECTIEGCDIMVTHGWLCLDGGELYCEDHVVIMDNVSEEDYARLQLDNDQLET